MAESEAAPAVAQAVAKETEETKKEGGAEAPAEEQDKKKGPENRGIRLHVKNLAETATTDKLKDLFKPYGEVLKAEAKAEDDGKCKGFGFVILPTKEEAEKAVAEMHGKTMDEKELIVEIVEPKAKAEGKGKTKGKGKDAKGDAKGKGKGKDKGGKGGKGASTYDAAASQADPYGYYGGSAYGYQAAAPPSPYAYQAMQMAQMAQLQYMQYAQMAQLQAYAQMATMGGSGLWSPAARAGAPPLSTAPPPAPPAAPVAAKGEESGKGDKGKGKAKGKGKGKSKDKESKPATESKSNAAPPPPDKEFVGTLKSISEKNGYGFIDCPDAHNSYNRDTWVDTGGLPSGAKVGDKLKFTISLSEKGHPRAQKVNAA